MAGLPLRRAKRIGGTAVVGKWAELGIDTDLVVAFVDEAALLHADD